MTTKRLNLLSMTRRVAQLQKRIIDRPKGCAHCPLNVFLINETDPLPTCDQCGTLASVLIISEVIVGRETE